MLTSSSRTRSSHHQAGDRVVLMSEGDADDDDDWTTEPYYYRQPQMRTAQRHPPRAVARQWPLKRLVVLLFSLLMSFCGSYVVYVCVSPRRSEALFTICSACHYFMTVGVCLGLGLLVTGLAATLVTSCTACWNCAFPTALLSVLFVAYALVCFTVSAAILSLRLSRAATDTNMQALWRKAVEQHPVLVCDVEKSLGCSGFEPGRCCVSAPSPSTDPTQRVRGSPAPCFYIDENGATLDPSTLSVVSWPSSDCPTACPANAAYNRACNAPLEGLFTRTFTSLFTTFVVLGGTFCLFAGFMWRRNTDSTYDRRSAVEVREDDDVQHALLRSDES